MHYYGVIDESGNSGIVLVYEGMNLDRFVDLMENGFGDESIKGTIVPAPDNIVVEPVMLSENYSQIQTSMVANILLKQKSIMMVDFNMSTTVEKTESVFAGGSIVLFYWFLVILALGLGIVLWVFSEKEKKVLDALDRFRKFGK